VKFVGDPTNSRIPYRDLLSPDHAAIWRGSMKIDKATTTPVISDLPARATTRSIRASASFTIADRSGNVAAMATSCGGTFVVPGFGFVLNDAMTDFGAASGMNAFASGKRPATPLSPTIILKGGRAYLAIAADLPTTVLQVMIHALIYRKPLYDSIAAGRVHQQADPDQIEYEQPLAPKATIDALNAMGHAVFPRDAIGDVQALMIERGKIQAVADPRHGGAAGGY